MGAQESFHGQGLVLNFSLLPLGPLIIFKKSMS